MNLNFIRIGIILLVIGVISISGCTQEKQTNTIIIQNFTFKPNPMHVKAGDVVRWTSHDNAPHKIVSDTGNFESPDLNNGDTFTYTFDKKGEFNYHDELDSSIKGKVIVG
ncbi:MULTISPECIES: cupredoxin domain-containing protein [Methanobacterium]|uniref:Cupredoxin domain-containing protein n=1 Tax=Methanobacterium veterum TaxID=408577 RepID=A0A9E5A2N7_9EURY|nr:MULTISPECIES: cupredoxin domain-containing protein [Methanobacterium]MCZ3364319.1 cupredoxin domain-containing protein [Methanobacterium veterum]MCZ3372069.1 cupredoxin domain-containing protein [Methanobacterium veterum]